MYTSFFTDSEPSLDGQANRVPSSRSLPSQKSRGSDGLGPLDEESQASQNPTDRIPSSGHQRDSEWLKEQLKKQHWQALSLLVKSSEDPSVAILLGSSSRFMERICALSCFALSPLMVENLPIFVESRPRGKVLSTLRFGSTCAPTAALRQLPAILANGQSHGRGAKLCHVAIGGRMVAVVTTMGQVTSYAKVVSS